jgi:hypothetical protein
MLRLRKGIVPGNAQREGGWYARWKRMLWEKWGRVALWLGMLWGKGRRDALVFGMFWLIRIDLEGGNALGNDVRIENKDRDQCFVLIMLL